MQAAAPGRYTVELARKGYNMVLLDLVPELLEEAKSQVRRAGAAKKVKLIAQGNIENLSMFGDEAFDGVLCLGGSLCHLLDQKRRVKAAGELVRVLKQGSLIFVSVIGRLALLETLMVRVPEEIMYAQHHWEAGDYIPGLYGQGFTAAHWFLPEELKGLFEERGIEVLEMAGLEGLSSHHERETNRLSRDPAKWEIWLQTLLRTCTHPSVVGISEHFLMVGRKSTDTRSKRVSLKSCSEV